MSDLIEVHVSVPSREAGSRIARALVERRLAACAQLTGPIHSTYRWGEDVQTSDECLLLAKTTQDRFEALVAAVHELHDYDVPEILSLPVSAASESYAGWLRESILPPAAHARTGPVPTAESEDRRRAARVEEAAAQLPHQHVPPVPDESLPPASAGGTGAPWEDQAASAPGDARPMPQGGRARLEGIVPVLPVSDLGRAIENYQRLGFTVAGNPSEATDGRYAFAQRGDAWLHLAPVDGIDPPSSLVAAFVYVNDAHQLYAEWSASGADGRFVEPEATPYGMVEGAYVDLDGNLLRFGSPLQA